MPVFKSSSPTAAFMKLSNENKEEPEDTGDEEDDDVFFGKIKPAEIRKRTAATLARLKSIPTALEHAQKGEISVNETHSGLLLLLCPID